MHAGGRAVPRVRRRRGAGGLEPELLVDRGEVETGDSVGLGRVGVIAQQWELWG